MKKLSIILAVIFALTALSLSVFADDEPDSACLGTFTVLHAQYNRGMGHHEIYLFREGDGIFRLDMHDLNDGESLSCEVTSDGSAEGDAAKALFESAREIKPGTEVVLYSDSTAPAPYYSYSENTRCNHISKVGRIKFGQLWHDPDPDHIEEMFSQLNACDLSAQDRKVQFEYEVADGELIVRRVELQPEEYLPRVGGLTILYSDISGNKAELVLGKVRNSLASGFYVMIDNIDDVAMPLDGLKVGTVVDILLRYETPVAPPTIGGSIFGILPAEGAEAVAESDYKAVVEFINEALMGQGVRGPMFKVTSDGMVVHQSATPEPLTPPQTGAVYAALPIIAAFAAIAIFRKPHR